MIYRCDCGKAKSVQPYRDGRVKRYYCRDCIDNSLALRLRLVCLGTKYYRPRGETVDARDLKSLGGIRAGSSPVVGTKK